MIGAAMAAALAATGPTVAIPGRFYAPQHMQVLAGETVTWRNDDTSDHTVTSTDAGFDSGRVGGGSTFAFTFNTPGVYEYNCTIHRYMRGTVEVDTLRLTPPPAPVAAGAPARLEGQAPAGTGEVTLQRLGGGAVATTTPDDAGRFAFTVTADAPARYVATAGDLRSGEAPLAVAPRLVLTARRTGRRVRAQVSASPAQARARVVLERYVAERFGWVRVRAATLGARSSAAFTIEPMRRVRLRARLAKPVGGWAPAVSRTAAVAAARR